MQIKRFCIPKRIPELYPDLFTAGSIRWLINNRHKNGLDAAVKRLGKRKLIVDLDAFENWLASRPGESKMEIST